LFGFVDINRRPWRFDMTYAPTVPKSGSGSSVGGWILLAGLLLVVFFVMRHFGVLPFSLAQSGGGNQALAANSDSAIGSASTGDTVRYGVGHEGATSSLQLEWVSGRSGNKVPVEKVSGTPQQVLGASFIFEIYYATREERDGLLENNVTYLAVSRIEDGIMTDSNHQYGNATLDGKAGKTGLRWTVSLAGGPGDYWLPVSGSEADGQKGAWIRAE
jgi:hypothetical protein